MIPQTHVFLEFRYWLVYALYPQKCFVINRLGEKKIQVPSFFIQQELYFPSSISYTPFSEETLFFTFQDLSASNYAQ